MRQRRQIDYNWLLRWLASPLKKKPYTHFIHVTELLSPWVTTKDTFASKSHQPKGRRVTIPEPRGRKSLPTKHSRTLLLPALCPPTTAIWGRSRPRLTPLVVRTSCSWLMVWITSFIPSFSDMLEMDVRSVSQILKICLDNFWLYYRTMSTW